VKRISLVIPNYNGGATLERTLRSVLDQNYPNLQLIVADSASTDESPNIIARYRDRIDVLIAEKDKGQADGLNKGFRHADGEIWGWLCSDDELLPGSLENFSKQFEAQPEVDVITGVCERQYADGSRVASPPHPDPWSLINIQCCIEQSATMWRGSLQRKIGELDTSFHLAFDWDFWNRFRKAGAKAATTDFLTSRYHFTESNKTGSAGSRQMQEMFRILRKYGPLGGNLAYVFRFLYNHFDLKGCYDKPPTCTLPRSHAFMSTLAILKLLIGEKYLYKYNWHFASCQQRGLKWW
jgi:glycosyltransferase involved in cell wall biosynthesis